MTDPQLANQLLRQRIAKMEKTILAYEASIHTTAIDDMRKRIDALENALFDVVGAAGAAENPAALCRLGLTPQRATEIEMLAGKKFAVGY